MITLNDGVDCYCGDIFFNVDYLPMVAKEFEAIMCWLSETPPDKNRNYPIKQTTRTAKCLFSSFHYCVDVNTLEQHADPAVNMNDIVCVAMKVQPPLAFDHYTRNCTSGSFILIDEASNNTVAAGG